jgi:hypothetical protein
MSVLHYGLGRQGSTQRVVAEGGAVTTGGAWTAGALNTTGLAERGGTLARATG